MSQSRRSQVEYARRMNAVVDHIDRHLDQKLDLATLAAVARFSPFHFHRLFQALMGESLGEYLRRRRILRDWLPKSGLQLDARPFFEHYPVNGCYDEKTGAFSCNICVPVASL